MADLDNLEYYIKFPSPGQQCGDNDFVFVVDEEKVPIVLLFGWAGCQDKYLSKYSQIYEDRGLITLRYTAPVKYLFWKRHHLLNLGDRIVKLLVDMNFESHPVIVHCFSNGGAFLYQNFSVALGKSSKPIELKGVIFDSAPGPRRILSLFRAMSAIIGGSFLFNIPVTVLVTAFLIIMWEYDIIKSYFFPDNFQSDPFEYLKREVNKCPQHFIYSKADTLILYTDVENFMEKRKQNGAEITSLRFDASPHVKHYTHHREEYITSVCNFLTKCLKKVKTN
ncbi:hypothetical protein ILUMI_24707 [Ignelater luminosus]|uniref:Transmembrane protein 53 n=1 Tax=Ignelater luminosus TaxID=2038154 RepID=A0A8K0CA00_IGNLU|nr:hypothetical protein ILUMI_24707 [Ignelater luminosus]